MDATAPASDRPRRGCPNLAAIRWQNHPTTTFRLTDLRPEVSAALRTLVACAREGAAAKKAAEDEARAAAADAYSPAERALANAVVNAARKNARKAAAGVADEPATAPEDRQGHVDTSTTS